MIRPRVLNRTITSGDWENEAHYYTCGSDLAEIVVRLCTGKIVEMDRGARCRKRSAGRGKPARSIASYSELILARNSPFDLALLSLSINSSIASTGESGFKTRRS